MSDPRIDVVARAEHALACRRARDAVERTGGDEDIPAWDDLVEEAREPFREFAHAAITALDEYATENATHQ